MEEFHYKFGETLPFSEDRTHEFKAHTNFCVEDLPKWCFVPGTLRRTRRAISRALNGFLNTGLGGTVYVGVLDEGIVKGVQLTPHQKVHLQVAMDDLMSRYQPKVEASRYKVVFVPVLEDEPKLDDSGYLSSDEARKSLDSDGAAAAAKPLKMSQLQQRSHKLRSPTYCWCDQQAIQLINEGIHIPSYIVELRIFPFKYRTDVDPTVLQLHPLYEDEEGRVYMRGIASLHCMTHQEVAELTRKQAREHFESVLKDLRKELLIQCEKTVASVQRQK